ncbi:MULTISPECIES: cytochrome c [unclassified Cupriavidus]|uniref:cytochrome c n=1 Tax=unclassified Cupriavidus TaxID=2640874 RepID=UPI00040E5B28|nr:MULTISPECIES: cytochrome c [unclassified Cupriavidus]MBP0628748.1 cytochrome c [Cupriavidus sp. AcVe19-1a]
MKAWIAKAVGALACAMVCLAGPASGAEPATLVVAAGTQQRSWTAEALLKDRRLADVTVDDDNLKRRLTFKAIPMASLLRGMPAEAGATATTAASDGYVSHLPLRMLLADSADEPRAWLAVENPARPWPKLKGQGIGPFRLIWTLPSGRAASVVNESHWTYSIVRIDITASPAERFAAIRPASDQPADGPVMRGFATFQRVCFSCHSLNKVGDAHLGPDLNVPHSAVEYMGDDKLAKLIRDPQSLRWWPGARMPAIDDKALSDADLKDLLAYLHHMAGRKGS